MRKYLQNLAADDIAAVLDHLRLNRADVVGLSRGGFATLHFGFRHAARARSLTVVGCGYGADPAKREEFRAKVANTVTYLLEQGIEKFAARYAYGPTRVQLENKSPRAFADFKRQLAEHSAIGSANTQLGVQRERPSLYELKDQMKALRAPTLILTGDEDWPCLLPGILMKETIPSSALAVMPNCGHAINIEDPDQFNRIVGDFLAHVDSGRWPMRDPRAVSTSITGMRRSQEATRKRSDAVGERPVFAHSGRPEWRLRMIAIHPSRCSAGASINARSGRTAGLQGLPGKPGVPPTAAVDGPNATVLIRTGRNAGRR